jgi:DNA/RNA-binding domain of Phe-tRNA-synthetase-like protein
MLTDRDSFDPAIARAIWDLRPDFVALSILVRAGRNLPSPDGEPPIDAEASSSPTCEWREAHLEAWRSAYRAFGAKPQRTPCSAEALLRRVQHEGTLPRINAIVDLYNALSVRYAVPIGGEDVAAYVGPPRLVRAAGDETFHTMRDGRPSTETVEPGEVIWRDDVGVTCRRWNWRQCPRTQLTVGTTDMWFVLERLEPMPLSGLHVAGDALVRTLRQLAPDAVITTSVMTPSAPCA